MVVIEEKHQQESNRQGNKDPFDVQIPKVDEPASIDGRIKSPSMWQLADVRCSQLAGEMSETRPEYRGDLPSLCELAKFCSLRRSVPTG